MCQLAIPMRKSDFKIIGLAFLVHLCLSGAARQATAQAEKTAYPAMAPLDAYLIADQNSEIALARSAAPPSIADGAEVMVLGRTGFTTAVKGTDGLSLSGGAIMGCLHRRSGILESQGSLPHLL
jgi:hypothetical protein